jgi:hypothetical protein
MAHLPTSLFLQRLLITGIGASLLSESLSASLRSKGTILLSTLIALLALTHTALSQDTSKIPTLQLWYEAKGIAFVNYIENYDVANGGANALIVSKQSRPQLWFLNSNTIDTTTRDVPECDPYWVSQADLNGDGIQEMVDWRANIFTRPAQDKPYNLKAVQRYSDVGKAFVYGRKFIDDFNGDGKQDFLGEFRGDSTIGKILIGGDDLTKLQIVTLPKIPNTAYSLQYIVGAWRDSDGSNKMVVYQQTDTNFTLRTEAFFLYSFQITGDKVSSYTALDTTDFKDFKSKWTPYYFYESSFVWHSNDNKEHTLVSARFYNEMYRIENNKFNLAFVKQKSESGLFEGDQILRFSVIDKNQPGYVRGALPWVYIYHGNPANDTNVRVRLPYNRFNNDPLSEVYVRGIYSIGDIDNDGKGDIAIVYNGYYDDKGYNSVVIYTASVLLNVDSQDNGLPNSSFMKIKQPYSLKEELEIQLRGVEKEVDIALFDSRGSKVLSIPSQRASADGIIRIPMTKYSGTLSQGAYILQCSSGGKVFQEMIIITE